MVFRCCARFARHIRTHFLAWVAEGTAGDVLEGHPALDELVRVPRRWWKSPREVWRMRQRLRSLQVRYRDRFAMFDKERDHGLAERRAAADWQSRARMAANLAGGLTTSWSRPAARMCWRII